MKVENVSERHSRERHSLCNKAIILKRLMVNFFYLSRISKSKFKSIQIEFTCFFCYFESFSARQKTKRHLKTFVTKKIILKRFMVSFGRIRLKSRNLNSKQLIHIYCIFLYFRNSLYKAVIFLNGSHFWTNSGRLSPLFFMTYSKL